MDLQMELKFDYMTVKARSCKWLEFEQQAMLLKTRMEVRLNLRLNSLSCILSLGQLCRAGWSVQQNSSGPTLESPDRTLRVPVFFQRNSLAIRGEVCRVVVAEDSGLDVPMVRAVVELEDKFRPEVIQFNRWEQLSMETPL